jgi:glutamine synthetase
MAYLDGVINRIAPPAPIDKGLYELPVEERAGIAGTPGSVEEALDALEDDRAFLLRGDVFTPDAGRRAAEAGPDARTAPAVAGGGDADIIRRPACEGGP